MILELAPIVSHHELSTKQTLAALEQEYEQALSAFQKAEPHERSIRWERLASLRRLLAGFCEAHHIIPSVAIGELEP